MARAKKTTEDRVAPLNPETATAQEPKAKGKSEPSSADCTDYDRLVQEVHKLDDLTSRPGWSWHFGRMLHKAEEARTQLVYAEKTRDLIRLQATVVLAEDHLKDLQQPVDDLNDLRGRWPLFAHVMPWRGDFDARTGRVALVWTGQGEAPQVPQPTLCVAVAETRTASPAEPTAGTGEPLEDEEENEDLDLLGAGPEDDDPFGNA
jgi:hypothetical protein